MKTLFRFRPNEQRRLVLGVFLTALVPFWQPLYANPTGPTIRHGDIVITGSGSQLQILQSTSRGIIDWNTFSISQGEVTQFLQPGSRAPTFNRVTGQSLSRIDGSLLANGRVFLLNPNGILIGRSGVVDTAGFTASTLDLSDQAFLSGGDLRFQGNSKAGVVNLGSINAFDGDVFLIAESVLNEGSISARNGTVGLAAGNDILIAESGSERVFVRGSGSATSDSGVINRGTVNANIAELKAYGGNIYGMAVQNQGRVAATAVSREGGQIFLRAGGGRVRSTGTLVARNDDGGGRVEVNSGEDGSTDIGGTVDVRNVSGEGGEILILGSEINLFEGSLLLADGSTNGGRIFVGGGRRGENPDFNNATNVTVAGNATLSANAGDVGNGGEIILFAENRLEFSGSLSATGGTVQGDGGFAEVSGKNEVVIPDLASRVDLTATNGAFGTLLFDPNDITIEAGQQPDVSSVTGSPVSSNTLFADDISAFLGGASLIIETNSDAMGGNGDISFVSGATIEWSTASNLTIQADRDYIQSSGSKISADGDGGVFITAGRSIQLTGVGTSIETAIGNIELDANMGSTPFSGDFSGVILDQAALTSLDGDIKVSGTGGGGAFGNRGILLRQNAEITSTGNGSVILWGSAGSGSAGQLQGVGLASSGISTNTGDITITGIGGGATGTPADSNIGIDLFASTIVSDGGGSISLQGTAGDSPGTSPGSEAAGIRLISTSRIETIGGGNITLAGVSGASSDSVGIRLSSTLTDVVASDTGNILLEADSIELTGGNIKSAGDLTVRPLDGASDINIGQGATNTGFHLDDTEIARFANGFSSITIGRADGSGTFNIGQTTFLDPVTLLMPDTGGEFFITGNLSGQDNASIVIEGSGSDDDPLAPETTYLSASILTQGNAITIRDNVVLEGNSSLDTTWAGAFAAGADIEIDGSVLGSDLLDLPADFAANAGTAGELILRDEIGVGGLIGNIDLRARTIMLSSAVDAVGNLGIRTVEGLVVTSDAPLTAGSNIVLEANQGASAATGDFNGVEIDSFVRTDNGTITIRGRGGNTTGNKGVFLTSESGLSGAFGVTVAGTAQSSDDKGVDAQGVVNALSGGNVRFETAGGEMDISGSINSFGNIEIQGAAAADTNIFVSSILDTTDLMVNGGGGTNVLDFSSFFSSSVNLQADQLANIGSLIGSSSGSDSFGGGSSTAGNFQFTGANVFTYSEGAAKNISVTGFESVFGGDLNDIFLIDVGTGVTFGGDIDGRGGDDTFRIKTGSVSSINGGIENTSRGDVLDFSLSGEDVEVDLEQELATFVGSFEDIETFVGSSGVSTISGTTGNDEIAITGDGRGSFTIPAELPPVNALVGGGIDVAIDSAASSAFPQDPPSRETVFFESFDVVAGAEGNDEFTVQIPSLGSFSGRLEGNEGDDRFVIMPGGGVAEINGGADRNTLDYTAFLTPVIASMRDGSATQVQNVNFIQSVLGGSGLNTFTGTDGMDEFSITGNGNGSITFPGKAGSETVDFTGFRVLEGAGGNDTFNVQLPSGEVFLGTLRGDGGEDTFKIFPGGGVASINGGSELDTLDFSEFGTPVVVNIGGRSATQVQQFNEIESVIGGRSQDTLIGRPVNDQFLVTGNGSGFLNSGLFSSFEILRGEGGADQFIFRNQATVTQAIGGPGQDSFVIDDSNLGGNNVYTISGNSVSRNPFYLFTEMEFLQLFLGPGNDTVLIDDNGLVHTINGGGGTNTIDFGTTPVSGLTPFLLGTTQVFATNFDNILLVRDETNNPENINPTLPGNENNRPPNGPPTDPFANTGGLGEAIGNAFGALASNALLAGQASLLQIEGGQVEAPLSLDGFFTKPPASIVQSLQQSLQVGAWAELANAIGFGGATILVRNDGPYSILLDQVPPNELLPILQQSLQPEAGRELF
ncbi:MAG: filamentous hemagglutinin N-terminal domain-containing protein, partial [Verrucomicrobiota bacterium]